MGAAGVRSEFRAIAGLVATVVVLVVAVLGAAGGGDWELEERDFVAGPGGAADERVEEAELPEPVPLPPPRTGDGPDLSWLGALGPILLLLLLAVAVWWAWQRWRSRSAPIRQPAGALGATEPMVEEPQLPVLQRGVTEARRYLAEIPHPTDAVIAAWLALEEAAATSGVTRGRAQTPTEFTVAVLERTDADPDATTELLTLYHRARFSGQAIGVDEVRRAGRCLGRLAASWNALEPADESRA